MNKVPAADGGQHRRISEKNIANEALGPSHSAIRVTLPIDLCDHVGNRDFIVECQNVYVRIRIAHTCRLEPRRGQLTNKNSIGGPRWVPTFEARVEFRRQCRWG